MDSQERIDRAVALKPAAPGEVPVAPLIIHYTAKLAGLTQADIFRSVGTWRDAVDAGPTGSAPSTWRSPCGRPTFPSPRR